MVKLLEEARLVEINSILSGLETGNSIIQGHVGLFSCKLAGADKELSKSLEQQYVDEMQSAAGTSSADSPFSRSAVARRP